MRGTIHRRKDGSLYTEYQSVTPILDGGGAVAHFVAIKEDITERPQIESQFRQAQKVLFMSGYTPDVFLRHGEEQARASFLNKPFTVASIREKGLAALEDRA